MYLERMGFNKYVLLCTFRMCKPVHHVDDSLEGCFLFLYFFLLLSLLFSGRNKQDKSLRWEVSTDNPLNYDQAVYLLYESRDSA